MTPEKSIFKAYDIRGIVGTTLTPEVTYAVGLVLGSMARDAGIDSLCVGRDGRVSGPELSESLMKGIAAAGTKVIDIGRVPTPVLYFAAHYFKNGSGVAVTGSHNPPEYNGLKMMLGGKTLFGEGIQDIYRAICENRYKPAETPAAIERVSVIDAYVKKITSDVKLARPMKVAFDCGNGVAGPVVRRVFSELGCRMTELFFDVDGNFPHHHPDPSKPANLQDLIRTVKEGDAELGLAFDGDADRLGVVTKSGEIIFPDRQMMLFAEDILKSHPGASIIMT